MTLLRGGRVVTPDGVLEGASVRLTGETIAAVGLLEPEPGEDVLDCSGCVVLPGGVESHSHLDLEAGDLVTADDFATGTRAALAGGTTTVIDFATAFHGQSLATALDRWSAKAAGRAVTDYAFHLAMTQWRDELAAEMAEVASRGVTSFKLYLAYRDTMMVDDGQVLAALTTSARLGATIGFHCENGAARRLPRHRRPGGRPHHPPLPRPDPARRARGRGRRPPRGHRRAGRRPALRRPPLLGARARCRAARSRRPATPLPRRPARSTSCSTWTSTAGRTTTACTRGRS